MILNTVDFIVNSHEKAPICYIEVCIEVINNTPSGCCTALVIKWYMVSKMKTECYSTHFLCITAIIDLIYRIPTNSFVDYFLGEVL